MKLPDGVSMNPENWCNLISNDPAEPGFIQIDAVKLPGYEIRDFTHQSISASGEPSALELPDNWAWFDRLFEIELCDCKRQPTVAYSVAHHPSVPRHPTITVVRNPWTKFGIDPSPIEVLGWASRKCSSETVFAFQSPGLLLLEDDKDTTLYVGQDNDKVVIPGGKAVFLFNLGGDSQPLVMLDVSSAPVDPSQSLAVPTLLIFRDRDELIFDRNGKPALVKIPSTTNPDKELGRQLCEDLLTANRRQEIRDKLDITVRQATPHVTLTGNPGLHIMGGLAAATAPGTLVYQRFMHADEQAEHTNPAASAEAMYVRLKAKRVEFAEYDDLSKLKSVADRHLVFYVLCMGDWNKTHWPQDNPDFVLMSDPSLLSSSDGVIVSLPDCCDTRSVVDEMQKLFDWVPLFIVDEPFFSLADWGRLGHTYLGAKQNAKPAILLVDYYRYCLLQDSRHLCDAIRDELGGVIRQLTLTLKVKSAKPALFHLLAMVDLFWEVRNLDSILCEPGCLSFSVRDRYGVPASCTVVFNGINKDVDSLELIGTNGSSRSISLKTSDNCYKQLLTGLRQAIPDRFEGLLTPNETSWMLEVLDSLPGGLL